MHSAPLKKIEDILLASHLSDAEKVRLGKSLLEETQKAEMSLWQSFTPAELRDKKDADTLADFIPSELEQFDERFGGFRRGELVIVACRSGVGKTSFLNRLALRHSAKRQVLYLQLEHSNIPFYDRLVREARLPKDYAESLLSEKEAEEELLGRKLKIAAASPSDIGGMLSFLEMEMQKFPAELVLIDQLQYLYTHIHYGNRDRELGRIAHHLHEIAVRYGCVLVVNSALNRGPDYSINKIPQSAHLRDSGNIEIFADKILFLYRPSVYRIFEDEDGNDISDLLELIVAKNRSGVTGEIRYTCTFDPFSLRLFPEAKQHFDLPEDSAGLSDSKKEFPI